ncbi:UpaP162 family type II restriction enzyme [Mycoplasma feriruminatoris]|uniref:UpaP162 family type II restriction enzyme n=1 Tax=Mycoplasma feriruminatoris TaxID=1179777 RepID=UPI0002A4D64D|nr:hypothetical protein [Mycoplasma feriruminatoris]UKS54438.1 hypothetical protein D500_00795 [Mycoplasma feriruminatoris]
MNNYYKIAIKLQKLLSEVIQEIFSYKNNELEIKVEDLNILQREINSVSSSSAIGFLVEEYLIINLLNYFNSSKNDKQIIMNINKVTNKNSYDFSIKYKEHLFYVNLKSNKTNNRTIAAIQKLYDDYVSYTEQTPLHFLVFKINYHIGLSTDNQNIKIIIDNTQSYFLEEINFDQWHQDKRSWSEKLNLNSGRLIVSDKFLKDNLLEIDQISYEKTKDQLAKIYKLNRNEDK